MAKALHADSTGSVANNYLYQGEDILAEYANGWAAATGFITHGATTDVPLTWQPAANDPVGSRYFHQDGLGSIVAMSTTSGTTDTERFDAWGAKLIGSGAIPLYGYTGREQDGTPATGTGYIYYRARYYDPANGRFTQRDPIELRGGINLYTYVGGNPIARKDPTGLYWFRQPGQPSGVVGRPDTIVEPRGVVSEFVEQDVPAGYTFGEMHDGFVDAATSAGIPDLLINIPSMIPVYGAALVTEGLRTVGILDQPTISVQSTQCK